MFMRVIAALALGGLALGQQATAAGSLSGKVTDKDGGVIPGATVSVIAGGQERKAITNPEGLYRIEGLPPGRLSVKAVLAGFQVRRDDIEVLSGREATWNLKLTVYTGGFSREPPSGPDPTDSVLTRGIYDAVLRYAFKGSIPKTFRVASVSLVPPDIDDRDWPKELAAVPAQVRAATRTVDAQRPVTLRLESLPSGGRLIDAFKVSAFDSQMIPYSFFSRVFPTDDRLGALVVFRHTCGSLCGEGSYVWLRRVSTVDTWVIQTIHVFWMS